MAGVEFVEDDERSDDTAADDPFARLRIPRWVWYAGVLAIAALVIGTIMRHDAPQHPLAAGPPTSAQLTPLPPLPSRPASTQDTVSTVPPDDITATSIGTWLLSNGRLKEIHGTHIVRSVRVPGLTAAQNRGTPRVVVDPTGHRVWVIDEVDVHSALIEFDAKTLRLLRNMFWLKTVRSAAALDGHLYLSTDLGVYHVGPTTRQPRTVPGLLPAVGRLAADASRDRIIALDFGFPTNAWAIRPGHRPVESKATLPFGGGTTIVAGDRIWVGGETNAGTVLQRLDPVTLAPQLSRHGTTLVGGGAHSIWLRSGNTLSCADAITGRVQQRWQLPSIGSVASSPRGAFVATRIGLVALLLDRCRG